MSVIKCKMCGGDLELIEGSSVAVCEYCGSQQTVPAADNEKKLTLFARANRLRLACEFDKAAGVYESIVADFPTEAEAYWGLVLCRYGIEYVDDPATGKKIPTCHRSSFDSVMEDSDFEQALENADAVARRVYRDEAKAIEELRRGIVEVSGKEPPYDIFICYKETAEDGQRTVDSVIAQDVYDALTEKGYRVFFSRISLEDKLGTEYEPYIFAALHSAKIMLAFGTDYEYYNAVWVKNEWSRYLQLMTKDKSKHLIPCYKGIDAYDMPKEFAKLQAQDMGKVGAMQDLLRGVDKIIGREKAAPAPTDTGTAAASATVKSLLKRVFMFLEDSDWDNVDEYCEKVLDIEPECAQAYLGKLMAELKVSERSALANCEDVFDGSKNYQKAFRFGSEKLKNELSGYIAAIQERKHQEEIYRKQRLIEQQKKLASIRKRLLTFQNCISCYNNTVGLKANGTVVAEGSNINGQCEVSDWQDIVAVSVGFSHTVGLKSDGTVVAVGENDDGECEVSDWRDIVAISVGSNYTVGLKSDGTVVAVGENDDGECKVSGWRNIVAISAGSSHTVGLKSDGTVVAVGDNSNGECKVSDWRDIVAVSAGSSHTVGLRSDGTVVAVGRADYGKCKVSDWRDIVAVSAGGSHTIGLKSDGTVVMAGYCDDCNKVSGWRDIVAVSSGLGCIIGLKSDGTVVATRKRHSGVLNWKLFQSAETIEEERAEARKQEAQRRAKEVEARQKREAVQKIEEQERLRLLVPKRAAIAPYQKMIAAGSLTIGLKSNGTVVRAGDAAYSMPAWQNIVALAMSSMGDTVGLKADGTVVTTGITEYDRCNINSWRNIVAIAVSDKSTVGLKADGTVVAVGNNDNGQCNVSDWQDIVAIAANSFHTVGLKADGTVISTYAYDYGDTSDWQDIVAIAVGSIHTVGLKADGTVVTVGDNADGQCNVSDWRDIVAIAASSVHTVGLKADGTVVAAGNNAADQCNVSDWRDIVAITASDFHTVGLKLDGTVVAVGYNFFGQCNVSDWKLFYTKEELLAEKAALEKELPTLKGLFSSKRRKEIENRLAGIETELKRLTE